MVALTPSRPSKPRFLRVLGPGLITGASDDDPSGIATYSQAGAQLGYAITWTLLFSYPLMAVIQEISGRIGRTTGKGLAGNMSRHYPRWLLQIIVALLFVANILNIGADLGAMGDALALLIGGPRLLYVVAFGVLCGLLQIFMQYSRYVGVLKWLTLALFTYFGTLMAVKIPWGEARVPGSHILLRAGLLDDSRGDHGHDHQPVSVLLAGLAGGRGYEGGAVAQAAPEGAAARTRCNRTHPRGHLRGNGVLQHRGARHHDHHRGDPA
jgi:hypothetical protein